MKTIVKRPSNIPAAVIGSDAIEQTSASSKVEFVQLLVAQEKRIQRLEKKIVELRTERDGLLEREAEQAATSVASKATKDEIAREELPAIDASEFQPMVDYVPYSPTRDAFNRVKDVARMIFGKCKAVGMFVVNKVVSILT